ncbi:NifU family protein [Candidatus Riflebacteria bacterium]
MPDVPINIWTEETPNPNTKKFSINEILMKDGTAEFNDKEKAENSPLAKKLFENDFVTSVFLGYNFLTVSKKEDATWEKVEKDLTEQIKNFIISGERVVKKDEKEKETVASGDDSEVVKKIKDYLAKEIRPALAMDGGDVTFKGYKDGVVSLALQGACRGCPGAAMTLKMGIEVRLKANIPEVKEVVPV